MAKFSVFETPDKTDLISICTWTKGTRSSLPQTDRVAFMDPQGQQLMADWDRVVAVAGHLLKPIDGYPPRFEVEGFPMAEELGAMGARRL